jgi:hypothetical protein
LTLPFSETWPSLTGGGLIHPSFFAVSCVAKRPSTRSFNPLNSVLAEGEADVCCCGIRCRSSRTPGSPAPVGCCRYYRSAQPAPTHPGSALPRFPAQGSLGLPVAQYSSARSCRYPPSTRAILIAAGSRRSYRCRRLRPGRLLAGFLRVLVTHCLLCEKRRVDLLQVTERRSSQPPWPPPVLVPSSAHWNPVRGPRFSSPELCRQEFFYGKLLAAGSHG